MALCLRHKKNLINFYDMQNSISKTITLDLWNRSHKNWSESDPHGVYFSPWVLPPQYFKLPHQIVLAEDKHLQY